MTGGWCWGAGKLILLRMPASVAGGGHHSSLGQHGISDKTSTTSLLQVTFSTFFTDT
ncbi:hypothetical protein GLAREA_08718 [Glarea lozoyensis ATCC 20868]|uniref:Uncharacterized protein n=1 Tax=Glarea lozoyensis (strain ATCC 20868 / MF5171) TaxID=1116229 RepID=S3DFM4_GLAL2|nr:uncharacterized protein GLAREA_08718 [Glarea lozoyensis ATCC 20868]EPE36555.1 hypothetical protein GLAREA_08718 [Glarea lozoyensis ATCC 20868]